jgi:hypothetical protein
MIAQSFIKKDGGVVWCRKRVSRTILLNDNNAFMRCNPIYTDEGPVVQAWH